MRRLYTYILVLLALGVACHRVDLPDNPQVNQPAELPTGEIGSKVTIAFSTADVRGPETRGIVNAKVDVETLHLIVFDENGMLVEVCKAEEHGSSDHDGHVGGRHYSVKLTVTDKPRIIHYVANCDVDQVVYGHETSVIGNMFVDRNHQDNPETKYEVSYWARIEVPHILVEETEEKQTDGTTKKVLSLVDDIKDLFMHVPLLRNYAEITVTQDENNNTFKVLGFTVYNLINRGTVAPYNSNTQEFQSFFEKDSDGNITKYLYPQMYKEFHYEGHALTSAQLITDLVTVKDENGNYKVKEFKPGEPFYVYERKVSVMTDEEEKWRESPPHIIIKARYNDGEPVTDQSPIYYYKMDLVYTEEDAQGTEEVKYYNLLRNFMYDFNITKIHDVGYESWAKAAAGAAGNNISGSSTTSKLTNVSDDDGRLWVSYTDITLVTNKDVVFKYKYIPNYYGTEGSVYTKGEVRNDLVNFQNIVGDVITGIDKATNDASDGWREVTIHVNEPSDITQQQILYLKTNNSNLNRQIRHTLRKKLTMQVECTPKVPGAILQPMRVDIKLPLGMTEDMFPLVLNMETLNRTLSPDADSNSESPYEFLRSIPVTAGPSIVEGRVGQSSYYYTVTIPTFDAYNKELPKDGDMKVVTTHWLTNMAANASTFYVENKYFILASDSWQNYKYEFSDVSCSSASVGEGQNVTISFKMADGAVNKQVTIALEGMTYSGTHNGVTYTNAKTFKYTPQSKDVTISDGLRTTTATDDVSFTLDADEYNIAKAEGSRETYKFNGAFVGVTSLETEADVEADFTFNISEEAFDVLKDLYPDAGDAGVPMFVTLDGLHPADDKLVYSQIRVEGDRYIYRIKQAGTQTIRLATTDAEAGTCTVTLQADYFDTQTVRIEQADLKVKFIQWNSTNNDGLNSSNMGYVIVGQTIRYYVGILSDSKPTSVTIDGKQATELKDYNVVHQPEGTEASRTVWYIGWSNNDKGSSHEMEVSIVVDGKTISKTVGSVKVDLILGNSTTNPTKDGKTIYVVQNQNTNYNTTYWTSANNNLSANESLNYSSLFTFEKDGNNAKIKSVAKGTYCTGNSNGGSISFTSTGTTYTFNDNGQIYNNRYIRQSSETTVTLGNNSSTNRSWKFYPIVPSLP